MAGGHHLDQFQQQIEVFASGATRFDFAQQLYHPWKSLAAGGAPAAGFTGVELCQVMNQRDRTGLIVEDDQRSGAQTAPDFFQRGDIQRRIQFFFKDESAGSTSREHRPQFQPLTHSTGKLLHHFADGNAERQLPDSRIIHLTAHAIDLGAALRGSP